MTGYTRQSVADIIPGENVDAGPLNNEFNAIEVAFNNITGHSHDGSSANGPKINLTTSVSQQLSLANGGTGATDAVGARANLGLAVGTNVQAYDAGLTSIAGLTTLVDQMLYTTAPDVYATTALTPFSRTINATTTAATHLAALGVSAFVQTLFDDVDVAAFRTSLGLGTMALQNAGAVAITGGTIAGVAVTGGTITGITDLAIADGGTGASTAVGAKTNLALENVDNTSDINKPISTAAQNALDLLNFKAFNYVYGLTLANNTTDPTNDIDVQVGIMKKGSLYVANNSVLTKRLDAAWAAGNNAGGLDFGSKANSTTYHVHALQKTSDGSFDALFSTSVSAPVVPTGYSSLGRVGSVVTNASGVIYKFTQFGNDVIYEAQQSGYSTTLSVPKAVTTFPGVPQGISVDLILIATADNSSGSITSLSVYPGYAPIGYNTAMMTLICGISINASVSGNTRCKTSTSKEIWVASTVSGSGLASLFFEGYTDYTVPRIGL